MTDAPGRRKRGRPPLDRDDPAVSVTVRLPTPVFDHFDRRARLARCSLPELLRRLLRKAGAFDDRRP